MTIIARAPGPARGLPLVDAIESTFLSLLTGLCAGALFVSFSTRLQLETFGVRALIVLATGMLTGLGNLIVSKLRRSLLKRRNEADSSSAESRPMHDCVRGRHNTRSDGSGVVCILPPELLEQFSGLPLMPFEPQTFRYYPTCRFVHLLKSLRYGKTLSVLLLVVMILLWRTMSPLALLVSTGLVVCSVGHLVVFRYYVRIFPGRFQVLRTTAWSEKCIALTNVDLTKCLVEVDMNAGSIVFQDALRRPKSFRFWLICVQQSVEVATRALQACLVAPSIVEPPTDRLCG